MANFNFSYLKNEYHEARKKAEKEFNIPNVGVYSFDMLSNLFEMAIHDVYPDGSFGDEECNVWSLFTRAMSIGIDKERERVRESEKETAPDPDPIVEPEWNNYAEFIVSFMKKHRKQVDGFRLFRDSGGEEAFTWVYTFSDGAALTAIFTKETKTFVLEDEVLGKKITKKMEMNFDKIVVYTTDDAKVRVFYEN